MRASAEVLETRAGFVTGHVEADRIALRARGVVELVAVALGLQFGRRLVLRQVIAAERPILLDDPPHLGLDRREVVGAQRTIQIDIVVESVLERGTVDQLRFGKEFADGLGHHVGRAVP